MEGERRLEHVVLFARGVLRVNTQQPAEASIKKDCNVDSSGANNLAIFRSARQRLLARCLRSHPVCVGSFACVPVTRDLRFEKEQFMQGS